MRLYPLANEQGCSGAQVFNTYSGEENGYRTEVALMMCPRNPLTQLGQITMLKAITDPRERSMPPEIMTNVTPMPSKKTTSKKATSKSKTKSRTAAPAQ